MERPKERSNHYRTLGLDPTSGEDMDQRVIDLAFKVMIAKKHPDHNGGTPEANRIAQDVNEARRVLGNPILRAKYDTEFRQHTEEAERSRARYEAELIHRLQEVSKAAIALQSQKESAEKEAQRLRTQMQAARDSAESEIWRAHAEALAMIENELQSAQTEYDTKANELVGRARAEADRHARATAALRTELDENRHAYERFVADIERHHQRTRLLALPVAAAMVLAFVSPAGLVHKSAGQVNGQRADKQRVVNRTENLLLPIPIPLPRPDVDKSVGELIGQPVNKQSAANQTAKLSLPIPLPRPIAASFVRDEPRPVPVSSAAPPDDAGLPADHLFHPHDKFTVDGLARQPIKLRDNAVGYVEPNREYPVDEIYQSSPGSSKIYYHVAGGWVHGRLDELHCSKECQEVWPSARSAQDARAEDEFLLRAKTTRLSEADGEGLQPGAARMRAKCNIVDNPIRVDRQNRDHIPGFFIRDGEDTNLLDGVPVLEMGDRVTIEDSYVAPGYAHWVYVSTDGNRDLMRRGWVSTSCLAANTRAE